MLVKLIDAADDVIELTDFTDFEEFAALDDFSLMSRIRMINPTESVQAKEAADMLELLESRILYKSAFEKVLHTEDQFVSRILTKQKVRESIQEEIATNAGVPANEVIVDVPTLPSIPYDIHQLDPMEIKIFEIIDRKKFTRNLSEYSSIADMMKVYLDVIRVYTSQKNRARVGRAAREVFKEIPDTALIHM
jgi:hypothetical protein